MRAKYIISIFTLLLSQPVSAAEKILIYAAASTSHAISEITRQFNQSNHAVQAKVSFASSSTLAKQISAGAPADIYISANPKWMDFLQQQQLILPATRRDLLSNTIVLIAPKGQGFELEMNQNFDLANKLQGKLCLGDPDHVPAGMYAKQAFQSLSSWQALRPQVVATKDVRAALTLVERGECAAGVVYATDARSSEKIERLGIFPQRSYSPVIYPAAAVKPANKAAEVFLSYLDSAQAQTIFNKYGFNTQK